MAIDSLGLDWAAIKGQHYPHLTAVEYEGPWNPDQSEELSGTIEQVANELIAGAQINEFAEQFTK